MASKKINKNIIKFNSIEKYNQAVKVQKNNIKSLNSQILKLQKQLENVNLLIDQKTNDKFLSTNEVKKIPISPKAPTPPKAPVKKQITAKKPVAKKPVAKKPIAKPIKIDALAEVRRWYPNEILSLEVAFQQLNKSDRARAVKTLPQMIHNLIDKGIIKENKNDRSRKSH